MNGRVALAIALLAAMAAAQQPIGEVQSSDATVRGAVMLATSGTTVMSGAQITAGTGAATLKLARGGELRVCPQSSITITSSASGREALVGLSNGAIEAHYSLGSTADSVVTPDFRIQLPGPGEFHLGIRVGSQGDACVQSLPGNTAAVVVTETFGEGTHQVKPGGHVMFRNGSVAGADENATQNCGCPPAVPVKTAEVIGFPEEESKRAAVAIAAGKPVAETPSMIPGLTPGKVYATVDASFVFRGDEAEIEPPPPPVLMARAPATSLRFPWTFSPDLRVAVASVAVTAPPPAKPPKKKWYQRLGAALASIFR